MELLQAAVPEGGFREIREIKGSPVPPETVLANFRNSAKYPYPILAKQAPRPGSMLFIAGGPTLLDFLPEIKKRKEDGEFICTSNNTHDFLVEHGIIPDACLIFDPKKRVSEYVKKPQHETTYYLGVSVVEEVFQAFEGFNVVKVCVAYGLDGGVDIELQRELYPQVKPTNYLIGGTMTPLRGMPFALLLGFKSIEFYGMDSCFSAKQPKLVHEDEPGFNKALQAQGRCYEDVETGRKYVIDENEGFFYAYPKARQEDIQITELGSRRFVSSAAFAWQAKQLVYWVDRLAGRLEVIVHGDSLSSALLASHRAQQSALKARVGDARWTEEYASLQRQMHDVSRETYGHRGHRHFELVSRALIGMYSQLWRPISWMDYGCGSGRLADEIERAFACVVARRYDPFFGNGQFAADPGPQDFVTCMDVFEHVEEECVDNTIDYIADRCRLGGVFCIATDEAMKTLPDGRNAHITIKLPEWWKERLGRRFQVIEQQNHVHGVTFVCVAIGATERMQAEKEAA